MVLPSYREAENLRTLLPELRAVLRQMEVSAEVLVIDTQSATDDTEAVCRENGALCIRREGGDTYGDAIRTGFARAAGEYVVVMDADGSHEPAVIPEFYREMRTGKYDLIIGSRYCRGGSTDNNLLLRLMSRVLNLSYRVVFGLRVRDVSDSFRMYRGEQVKAIRLECRNFDIVEEILITLSCTVKGFSAKEVPIRFQKRAAGESKRDLLRFIGTYLQTMRRLMRIKRRQTIAKRG